MSDRVQTRRAGTAPGARQTSTKAERRAAAKAAKRAAAARAARLRLIRQMLTGALAIVAVVAVIFGVVTLLDRSGDDANQVAGVPEPTPSATAERFPPLPDGADPALATKPTVTAGSGKLTELVVTPLIEGTGPAAQAGQEVTVNYVGVSYQTGEEFDSSWSRSQPFSFRLGSGGVIDGWDQGLVGVTVGSRVQLDIPAELAYGENPEPGYPAGPLRFVIDVLAVQ